MLNNKFWLIFPVLLLVLLSIGIVAASDNITGEIALDDEVSSQNIDEIPTEDVINESSSTVEEPQDKVNTKINVKDITTYYKEKSQLVSYLKDANNKPISNKKVSISINKKVYNKITDKSGKVTLKLNLKPKTYTATVTFAGDDSYAASSAKVSVKVNKASLTLTTKNYKTYFESGFYFKAKVINKITKNPVKDVKVAFKVYTNHKYKIYYATTNSKGIASLKKNIRVGSHKVVTSVVKNKNIKSKSSRATLTIKPTAEMGCSSLYVQVSNFESVAGFRRDATFARDLHIVKFKLCGKDAVKQYKRNSYFFHLITTADGWMMGTGGWDNAKINSAIEHLGGLMAKSGKFNKNSLKKIQRYEKNGIRGHFSIKAPNGKYAIVWGSKIRYGELKPGEYIRVPNSLSYFKHGTWAKFSENPTRAAVKIAANDPFGINRRDVTVFHWKATTKDGKTNSTVTVRTANDNGKFLGRSTGHLRDNVYFKDQFISKYKLPKVPYSKYLGTIKFGSIDKLIKKQTVVKAPKLTKHINKKNTLNITVKNKQNNNLVKGLKLKLKIGNKVFSVKTNSKGVAKFNPASLKAGNYIVIIYSADIKYYVSAKTKITVKE